MYTHIHKKTTYYNLLVKTMCFNLYTFIKFPIKLSVLRYYNWRKLNKRLKLPRLIAKHEHRTLDTISLMFASYLLKAGNNICTLSV